MAVRRLVTGTDAAGKSIFVSMGTPPCTVDYVQTPGFRNSFVWATPPNPQLPPPDGDPTLSARTLPPPGGTTLVVITYPPDAVMQTPEFDAAAAQAEHLSYNPNGGAVLDPDRPGMHTTNSIDYIIMLEGHLCSELDDGRIEELGPGDILIQNGTRHAWRNRTDKPATMIAVVVGAQPPQKS
jgi:mannose-6-phosphate isomerase-like protein (cupin superfamily)